MIDIKVKKGDKVDMLMKPVMMKNWFIIKETKKCLVVRKYFEKRYGKKNYLGDTNYILKKDIVELKVKENE